MQVRASDRKTEIQRSAKANLLNASRPDRTSPIAARAPEFFIMDRDPRTFLCNNIVAGSEARCSCSL